tara:strand:+ start:59 stop:523 length:465 start_codon:yes stop_codon:yes gene_type:complete
MATLTTNISESVVLNGSQVGGNSTVTHSDITEVFKRTVTCIHSQTTILQNLGAAVGNDTSITVPTLDSGNVRYIRITNLSSTLDIELAIVGATNYQITLLSGQSHILGRADVAILAEADASPSFGTMAAITSIQARPTASTDVNVELFVASVTG